MICKIAYVMIFISCINKTTSINHSDYLGDDYRLFKQTPIWELAKAVKHQHINKIKYLIKEKGFDLNYQEPKFGETLLMLTVLNQDYKSCKALLDLGANSNINDFESGTTALIYAAEIENFKGDNTKFLKLLLKYGADPNVVETGERKPGNCTRKSPLIAACGDVNQFVSPIHKVKLLIEAGANVNYHNEFGTFPLEKALIHEHYGVALYLLQHGANYNEVIIDRSKYYAGGEKLYIADVLRECMHPLSSEKYQQKMEIVDFLKEKGIDYKSTPIPEFVIKDAKKQYPDSWQEYLNNY